MIKPNPSIGQLESSPYPSTRLAILNMIEVTTLQENPVIRPATASTIMNMVLFIGNCNPAAHSDQYYSCPHPLLHDL